MVTARGDGRTYADFEKGITIHCRYREGGPADHFNEEARRSRLKGKENEATVLLNGVSKTVSIKATMTRQMLGIDLTEFDTPPDGIVMSFNKLVSDVTDGTNSATGKVPNSVALDSAGFHA